LSQSGWVNWKESRDAVLVWFPPPNSQMVLLVSSTTHWAPLGRSWLTPKEVDPAAESLWLLPSGDLTSARPAAG
jgi:hypothetical protein